MLAQFDICGQNHASMNTWFIDSFINNLDEFAQAYIREHWDEWSTQKYMRLILDHHYMNKDWFIIFDAHTRTVLFVGEMPKDWNKNCEDSNGLLACLIKKCGLEYSVIRDNLDNHDNYENLHVSINMYESFNDIFDSSVVDIAKNAENKDLKMIYHPEVIADVNDTLSKMRTIRDEWCPLIKDFKMSKCSIKSRMPKNFRTELFNIHKTSDRVNDWFIEWGIRYNWKLGKNLRTSTFLCFWKNSKGEVIGIPGGSCALEYGSPTYNFIEETLGGVDKGDGDEWWFNTI